MYLLQHLEVNVDADQVSLSWFQVSAFPGFGFPIDSCGSVQCKTFVGFLGGSEMNEGVLFVHLFPPMT